MKLQKTERSEERHRTETLVFRASLESNTAPVEGDPQKRDMSHLVCTSLQSRRVTWLMNDELQRISMKLLFPNRDKIPEFSEREWRERRETSSQDKQCSGRKSNQVPPEYRPNFLLHYNRNISCIFLLQSHLQHEHICFTKYANSSYEGG
jgi:hypothetical protein